MKIRKGERPSMEAVLTREDDLDTVVELAFATAVDVAMTRDWYVAIVQDKGGTYLFGPYESEAKAKQDMKRMVSAGPEPSTLIIRKMYKLNERLM